MRTLLLRSIAATALTLAAGALRAESNPYRADDVDWASITGSVPANNVPFFRLIPPQQAAPAGGQEIVLQRLPVDSGVLRFEGENGHRDIAIFVRKDQAGYPATLKVRFKNSVAVMPEASRLRVSLNDKVLAEVVLDSSGEPGNVSLPIPAGLLEAGYNAVTFDIQQRHRVDCSIEAASELWTEIDPAMTGISMATGQDQMSLFDDLVAMPASEDGAVPITIVLPQGADNAMIDQSIRAAQALILRVGWKHPKIAFARDSSTEPGIQLHVGAAADIRNRGLDLPATAEPTYAISGRANGIVRIIVSGANVDDVNQNIFRLLAEKPNVAETGTAAGLRARARQQGYRLEPESEIALHQTGLKTESFNGRVYRTSFNILLPPDFYPADNGKATVFVDGSYVAGLAPTNEMLVRINGKVAGAARLSRTGGDTMTRRPVEVTLKALQAGFNAVTLEVRSATDTDKDCNPLNQIDAGPRVTVQDTTAFALPRLSRIRHLPSLSATAANGFPFGDGDRPVTVYMPKPDLAALGSAATLIARTAISAGKPIDTRMAPRPPDERTQSAVFVGAFRDMPQATLEYFGIKNDMVPKTWQPRLAPSEAKTADNMLGAVQKIALKSGGVFATTDDGLTTSALPTEPREPATPPKLRWTQQVEEVSTTDRMRQSLSNFLQRNIGYTPDQLSFLHGDKSAITATRQARLLLAQQQSMAGGNNTWLLLTGPDSATIQRETTGLISQSNWNQMQGRMVAFDPSEKTPTAWPEGRHYYYQMQDWSFSNVTLFAAGWLSNHIQYYVLVILLACLSFGLFTRKLLNRIGAQP